LLQHRRSVFAGEAIMALDHKGRKHSKRRNVGLVHDFLIRHIVDSVLRDDDVATRKTVSVIKRCFRPGTELYREWRLFNAVIKTQGVDETMANAIIRETRDACRKYDRSKLDREKSLLIREINHVLGQDVYERQVPNYRMFATIQTLFNDWRDTGIPNISRIADYEHKLQRHLMSEKVECDDCLVEGGNPADDALVVRLMTEKLNHRYAGKLNDIQRSILSMYVLEGHSTTLVSMLTKLKERVLTSLAGHVSAVAARGDVYTAKKLVEAREVIDALDPLSDDDAVVARFMKLSELCNELEEGDVR
jgi:hypothetical protein